MTALLTVIVTVSAMAASDRFTDVLPGDVHDPGISCLAEPAVTSGSTAQEDCPNEPVTRAQMGTFMHRLSGNAGGIAPSVDAATLQGLSVEQIQAGVEVEPPEGSATPDAATNGDLSPLEERLLALEEQVEELESLEERVEELEARLVGVSREEVNGEDTLRFSEMNLQVCNGTGSTGGDPHGVGNLLIGYDTEGTQRGGPDKSGSHNLVIRGRHNYSSYGGIVAGLSNTIEVSNASVLGGGLSLAAGDQSVVVGGSGNQARAPRRWS